MLIEYQVVDIGGVNVLAHPLNVAGIKAAKYGQNPDDEITSSAPALSMGDFRRIWDLMKDAMPSDGEYFTIMRPSEWKVYSESMAMQQYLIDMLDTGDE